MKLIVGLGNPGEKYASTRHNIGFMVIDAVVKKLGDSVHQDVKFLKPDTFMNESGRAVLKEKNFYKIDSKDIVVVHDDVDLELGKIKVVLGGSSAGHKGVQSIIDSIGTEDFWRVRVGIGRDEKIPTDAWVLQNFTTDTTKIIDEASDYVIESLNNGIENKNIIVPR